MKVNYEIWKGPIEWTGTDFKMYSFMEFMQQNKGMYYCEQCEAHEENIFH